MGLILDYNKVFYGERAVQRRRESDKKNENMTKKQSTDRLDTLHVHAAQKMGDTVETTSSSGMAKQERCLAQKYLDVASVMILSLGLDGKITLLNKKGYQILGYKEKELIGEDWFDTCLPDAQREDAREVFLQLVINN